MLSILFGLLAIQLALGFYIFFYVFQKFNDGKLQWLLYSAIVLFALFGFAIQRFKLDYNYLLFSLIGFNIVFAFFSIFIVRKSVLRAQKRLMTIDLLMNVMVPLITIVGFAFYSDYIVLNNFSHKFINIANLSFALMMLLVISWTIILTMSLHVTIKYYLWGVIIKKSWTDIMDQVTNHISYVISGLIGMVLGIIILAEANINLEGALLESYYQTLDVYKSIFLAFTLPTVYDFLRKAK